MIRRSSFGPVSPALVVIATLLLLRVGPAMAAPPSPGGLLAFGPVTFTDEDGRVLQASLRAQEFSGDTGRGNVSFILNTISGRQISACTVRGPAAQLDITTGVGNYPLQDVQCGGAGNQIVSVDDCLAHVQAHGYAHVDAPETPVLGTVGLELRFQRDPGRDGGQLEIRVHSYAGQLIVRGHIEGPITMDTCP